MSKICPDGYRTAMPTPLEITYRTDLICTVIIMLAMHMNGTVEGNVDYLYCRLGRICYPDIL
jgi:hypothetical protein